MTTPALPEDPLTQRQDRIWMEYGRLMAMNFREAKLTFESLSKVKSFRNCISEVYKVMVRTGIIDSLEKQEPKLKQELWDLANEHKSDMLKDDMIAFCKCALVLEVLL